MRSVALAVIVLTSPFWQTIAAAQSTITEFPPRKPPPRPPSSQPSSQPASQPTSEPTQKTTRSADELRQQRRDEQIRRAVLERTNRDLAAQKDLLSQAMQELLTREETFESQRKTWKEEQLRLRDSARDEGFEQELKFVAKLSPKQGKDHLVKTWKKQRADAVRLVSALPTSAPCGS